MIIILLAIIGQALGQASCGCSPQPTVIQISCNGPSSVPTQQAPLPAPAPAAEPAPEPAPATDFPANDPSSDEEQETTPTVYESGWDFEESWCEQDPAGLFTGKINGGWPSGYRWNQTCAAPCACTPHVHLDDPTQPRPPPNWNYDMETLDFDWGYPGKPTFSMIMCWPVPVSNKCREYVPWINRFKYL